MELTEERMAAVMRYCHLEEFAGEAAVEAQVAAEILAADGYLASAGVALPEAGTLRRAQYDLAVNYLVLDAHDRRDATITGSIVTENPSFRRLLNQLKLTEPPASNWDAGGGG